MGKLESIETRLCLCCAQITANGECTGCEPDAYSHRHYAAEIESGDTLVIAADEPSFRNFGRCGSCGSTLGGDYWDALITWPA